MTDYTPTTEEVKFDYAMHKSVVSSRISEDGKGEKLGKFFDEFDRWLAALRAEWEAEQGEVNRKLFRCAHCGKRIFRVWAGKYGVSVWTHYGYSIRECDGLTAKYATPA